jgi:hypothetical protein
MRTSGIELKGLRIGRVFYFGGFDAHGGPHTATARLVKGAISEP